MKIRLTMNLISQLISGNIFVVKDYTVAGGGEIKLMNRRLHGLLSNATFFYSTYFNFIPFAILIRIENE